MLKSILTGLLLTILSVGIHAAGTSWWIQVLSRQSWLKISRDKRLGSLQVLCLTATVLLLLHFAEVAVWGLTYWLLLRDQFNAFEQAVYFSMVTFTSLGYGDVVISGPWRLLAGIQAIAGLLLFGWSTALLFSVVQRLWELGNSKK